jgi:hypothetical protein
MAGGTPRPSPDFAEHQQMLVTANDDVHRAFGGSFQHAIVIRIMADGYPSARNHQLAANGD